MLFWVSFVMFNLSYLFSVVVLGFLVLVVMMVSMGCMVFVKFLVILVYVSGVVTFILYISCMCWGKNESYSKWFLVLGSSSVWVFDSGVFCKFSDVGESMWLYLLFSFMFNGLVMSYCLNLFKASGSLRL